MKLGELEKWRAEIFKVELGGWLHNFGKFSPEFIKENPEGFAHWCGYRKQKTDDATGRAGTAFIADQDLKDALLVTLLTLPQPFEFSNYPLARLIESFRREHKNANADALDKVLGWAHEEAMGAEKRPLEQEMADTEGSGANYSLRDLVSQRYTLPWWSLSPFGYPSKIYQNEDAIQKGQQEAATEAKKILNAIGRGEAPKFGKLRELLTPGLAESRIPVCDIRISDMGLMGSAFAKAALAESLLTGVWRDKNLEWRLLRLAVDGLAYVSSPARIPEVMSRQRALEASFDSVREEIEQRSLCGTEVYRDEYGPVYVIPGFGSAQQRAAFDAELSTRIQNTWEQSAAGEDAGYRLCFSKPFGLGAKKGYAHQLGSLLREGQPQPSSRPSVIQKAWSGLSDGHQHDVCTACSIRPIGLGDAAARRICRLCFDRRTKRVEEWLKDPSQTIWMEEAADKNGRVAAIAAKFRIESWLSGTDDSASYLESTVFLKRGAEDEARHMAPSSARLRRIFETLKEFWADAEERWGSEVTAAWTRVALIPDMVNKAWATNNVYELESLSGDIRLSAVWTGSNFLIVDQVERFKRLLPHGEDVESLRGKGFSVRLPTGYRRAAVSKSGVANEKGSFVVERTVRAGVAFEQSIPILRDPRQFITVVPANRALACAEVLSALYAERFGRVRNRLGLDLTVIAAPVDTPVRTILDAARRGLRREVPVAEWDIHCVHAANDARTVRFANGSCWTIPLLFEFPLANGSANKDDYFPYFQFPEGETVHVEELEPGDTVRVEPCTFDYEFLDSSSRRFELSYDNRGRRRGREKDRPLLMEDLDRIKKLWEMLHSRFATRQIRMLEGFLDAKRGEWQAEPAALVDAAIRNMERKPSTAPLSWRERRGIAAAAASGLLATCIEWHLAINSSQKSGYEED